MDSEGSSLRSLSTELLLLIFEHLSLPALLALSKTSRSFHYLALPIYLSRHGIMNPEPRALVLENRAVRALPGLEAALFITSLDYFSYKFVLRWEGEGSDFVRSVQQLHRFVYKLTEVKSVALDLGNIDSRWLDGLAIVNSAKWQPDFLRLLDTILDRKCTSLTVTHGYFLPSSSLKVSSTYRTRVGDSVSAVTSFLGSSLSVGHKVPVRAEPPLHADLQMLCVHSNLLLSHPVYDWTMQTINRSSITSLSLRFPGWSSGDWAIVLSSIAVPSLKSFTAETIDIALVDLLKFLSRHPSIQSLNLHPYFNYSSPQKLPRRSKKLFLPQLASLSGNPKNIKTILSRFHSLPRLHAITLTLPLHQRVFRIADFEKLSMEIGRVVQGITPTVLALRFSVPYDISREEAIREQYASTQLPSVTTIAFSTDGHFAFSKWTLPLLPTWLTSFKSLQNVSLAEDCVPADPESRRRLINSISQKCPKIRAVTFGEQYHVQRIFIKAETEQGENGDALTGSPAS